MYLFNLIVNAAQRRFRAFSFNILLVWYYQMENEEDTASVKPKSKTILFRLESKTRNASYK